MSKMKYIQQDVHEVCVEQMQKEVEVEVEV